MASFAAGGLGGLPTIDFAKPLAGVAPPGMAFAVDGGGQAGRMAVAVQRGWPARARALTALAGLQEPRLLLPVAHGPASTPSGEVGYFVICPAPPGPSLQATLRPWPEAELIERLIKPAAGALASLEFRNVTHRAIRPDNLFQSAPGAAVVLGCAWTAPPACHQPNWMEPPTSAACTPCGRGDGTVADDVYALGATMVMLALGCNPVDGVSDDALLGAKGEHGSYAALVGSHRLPSAIAELARGMLADDPDHRPSPALLATPAAARARRIAARPIRRAQRALELGGQAAWTARTLASAMQRQPAEGLTLLRNGMVDRWLRRSLGDALLAGQLDEVVRLRDVQAASGDRLADPTLLANAAALLDPSAPLTWRGVTVWPDGLGPALDHALHHAPAKAAALTEIAIAGLALSWSALKDGGRTVAANQIELRDLGSLRRDKRADVVPWQLCYGLNPLSPCHSPLLRRHWVTRLGDLLPAMEASAAGRVAADAVLFDAHVVAFVAARRDERMHRDLGDAASGLALDNALGHVQLAGRMQTKLHPQPLPNLCAWAVETVQTHLQRYRSRTRRTRMAEQLAAMAVAGSLPAIAGLVGAPAELTADTAGADAAEARLAAIRQTIEALGQGETATPRRARKAGEDIAGGLSALACLAALAWALFA